MYYITINLTMFTVIAQNVTQYLRNFILHVNFDRLRCFFALKILYYSFCLELDDILSKLRDILSKLCDILSKLGDILSKLGDSLSKLGNKLSKLDDNFSKLGDHLLALNPSAKISISLFTVTSISRRRLQDA